jgi:hypothetical protein
MKQSPKRALDPEPGSPPGTKDNSRSVLQRLQQSSACNAALLLAESKGSATRNGKQDSVTDTNGTTHTHLVTIC